MNKENIFFIIDSLDDVKNRLQQCTADTNITTDVMSAYLAALGHIESAIVYMKAINPLNNNSNETNTI